MAQPFGGHPTLGQYLAWARGEGCKVTQGYTHAPDGRPYSVTHIVSPDGERWVFDIGTQQSDYLVPTTIARLDRRLGMRSPYFSLDDSGYEPSS